MKKSLHLGRLAAIFLLALTGCAHDSDNLLTVIENPLPLDSLNPIFPEAAKDTVGYDPSTADLLFAPEVVRLHPVRLADVPGVLLIVRKWDSTGAENFPNRIIWIADSVNNWVSPPRLGAQETYSAVSYSVADHIIGALTTAYGEPSSISSKPLRRTWNKIEAFYEATNGRFVISTRDENTTASLPWQCNRFNPQDTTIIRLTPTVESFRAQFKNARDTLYEVRGAQIASTSAASTFLGYPGRVSLLQSSNGMRYLNWTGAEDFINYDFGEGNSLFYSRALPILSTLLGAPDTTIRMRHGERASYWRIANRRFVLTSEMPPTFAAEAQVSSTHDQK